MIKRLFLAACLFALFSGSVLAKPDWSPIDTIPPPPQASASLFGDSFIHVSWANAQSVSIVYDVQQSINGVWQPHVRAQLSPELFTAYVAGSYQYRVRACNIDLYSGGPVDPPPMVSFSFGTGVCSAWSELTNTIVLSEALDLPVANVESPPEPYGQGIRNDLFTVGATAGNFRVDESGAATYTLPINLPLGIAGNTPELSLNYHSQAGNGALGVGWSIGGISSIERCRQTPFQDNAFRAITLSADDRFCLDGQRLVVTNGQYGAIGAVYATEIDSFIEVRSIGGRYGHPDSFEVRRPDGSIAYYGSHSDSRFSVENNVTLSWSLNELSDQLGMSANRIRYHYSNIGGELLISEVTYSGNRVSFNYVTDARPDRAKIFVFDRVITPSALLQNIRVQNHRNLQVYRLELDYAPAPLSGIKRLESITECGLSNQCLRPLTFDWNDASVNSPGFNTLPFANYSASKGQELVFSQAVDMTGNGFPDLVTVYRQANTFHVRMRENTGTGLAAERQLTHFVLSQEGNRYPFDLRIVDTTGSGVPEIIYYSGSTQKQWRMYSLETNTTSTLTSARHLAFHDFNGNGLADILLGDMRYQDNLGGRFSAPTRVSMQNTGFNCGGGSCQFSHSTLARSLSYDINGDGLNDLIIQMTESSFVPCDNDFPRHPLEEFRREIDRDCPANINHFWGVFETKRSTSGQMLLDYKTAIGGLNTPANTVVNLQAVDMNGDGIADLLYFDTSANRWRISYSSQTSIEPESVFLSNLVPTRNQAHFLQPVDLTGNGVPDIVYYDSRWKMISYPFTEAPRNISGPIVDPNSQTVQFTDMRGDGQVVLMVTNYTQGRTQWYDSDLESGIQPPVPPPIIDPCPRCQPCMPGEICEIPRSLLPTASAYSSNNNSQIVPDKIGRFVHGHGLDTVVDYSFLNNSTVYVKGNTGYPNEDAIFDVIGSIPVVSQVTSKTGVGSVSVSYAYGGGRIQALGRGFLGFELLAATDLQSGITTTTTYHQRYPLTGMPKETRQTLNGILLSLAQNTYGQLSLNSGRSVFPYLQRAYEEVFHLNSNGSTTRLSRSLTRYQYEHVADRYAQLRESDSHIRDELHNQVRRVRTVNTYAQDNLSRWILSRLTRTRVTHQQGTGSVGSSSASVSPDALKTVVRTSAFGYDSNGLLIEEVIEPEGNNESYLKTVHGYDSVGNRIRSTVCSKHYSHQCGGNAQHNQGERIHRSTETVYDAEGRYVIAQLQNGVMLSSYSQFNALGQAESITEKGVRSLRRFNAFGQLVFTRTQTTTNRVSGQYIIHRRSYDRSELSVPAGAPSGTWYERIEQGGMPTSWTVKDGAGRILATIVQGFNSGQYRYQLTRYDAEGRIAGSSQPTFNPSSAYWNSKEYDILSRIRRVTAADGTVTTFRYQGATTTQMVMNFHSGSGAQIQTSTQNAFGEQHQVTDGAGALHYEYDATGNLLRATGVDEHSMLQTYNVRGFKKSMSDPDSGSWSYDYNALGEMIRQTDPRNYVTHFDFDTFGRKHSEKTYRDTTLLRSTTWTFSDDSHSVWGLITGERVDGSDTLPISRLFDYDAHGRLISSELDIGGEVLTERTTYDEFSRVFQQFDASGNDFGQQFEYQNGYTKAIWEARYGRSSSVGTQDHITRYQLVRAMDAYGNVTTSEAGSRRYQQTTYDQRTGLIHRIVTGGQLQNWTYEFDGLGNLRARRDELHRLPSLSGGGTQAFNETFEYDVLNRLTQVRQGGSPSMTLTYHANGNIRSKSDVQGGATYSYGTRASSCSRTAGPRAVTQVGNQRYCYDAMGNQTHQYNGNSLVRQIEYNALGKASRIRSHSDDSANGSSVGTTRFTYDGSGQQVRRQSTEQGETTTIIQLGNTELILNGSERRYRRNLGNAIVEHNRFDITTRYIYTDHLGNTDVITDESGRMLEKLSFDAFGKRRAVFTLASQPIELNLARVLNLTHQGFTGHQQVDHAGIVQMGGRIYDSHLGRFLQADPFIQAPDNSQNFNRYSYVLNNPLSYTDPSGYFFKKLLRPGKNLIRGVSRALGHSLSSAIVTVGSVFCGPWAPACAAAGTYEVNRAHGASSSQAFRSASVAGASQWVFGAQAGAMSAQQAAMQIGTMTLAASNPALGQALMYVQGSWGQGFGGWAQNAVGQYGQLKTQQELGRFAARNGLTLQELNLLLGLNSKIGLKLAGTTFDLDNATVEGFSSRRNAPLIGVFWDINDTLLNAQGLLDAVSMSVVNSGYSGHLTGHSLGAWRVNNLLRMGHIESATLLSLPGFAYPSAGSDGYCASMDLICGGRAMSSLRPSTTNVSSPSRWDWIGRNHGVCSVRGYQDSWGGRC